MDNDLLKIIKDSLKESNAAYISVKDVDHCIIVGTREFADWVEKAWDEYIEEDGDD